MKTILSCQNAITGGKDIFVIDGEKSEYSHSMSEENAIEYLHPTNKMKSIVLFKTKKVSRSLKIYLNGNRDILITSNFASADQIGRKIVFSFYCSNYRNIDWLCSRLTDYASIAGMEVNQDDILTIKKSLEVYSKRYLIIGCCLLAIILLVLVI